MNGFHSAAEDIQITAEDSQMKLMNVAIPKYLYQWSTATCVTTTSMVPFSSAKSIKIKTNGIKASSRVNPQNVFLGQVVERHQNRPFLSVEFETKQLGGQIKQHTSNFTSSKTGIRIVFLFPPFLAIRFAD